jgi:serine/threonine-protein kinase
MVKVVDFGLARAGDVPGSATPTGQIWGTPLYMSPEQCQGIAVDTRADLYSLTCTYFHLLTGRPPFEKGTAQAIMYGHCNQSFPDAREFVPDVPEPICRILAKGSRKDPNGRYSSATDLIAALDAVSGAA